MVFKIQPHNRLQEWVAEEKGYFADEGLAYEFHTGDNVVRHYQFQGVQSTEEAPAEVKQGAFEAMEAGRTCDISSACHWAVNMASSAEHGRMWGNAYSMAPSGIYVAPESSVRTPSDLLGVEIGVGYHSGSHFSALQALEPLQFRLVGVAERVGADLCAAHAGKIISAKAAKNVADAPDRKTEDDHTHNGRHDGAAEPALCRGTH
jgi:hypothetical protein